MRTLVLTTLLALAGCDIPPQTETAPHMIVVEPKWTVADVKAPSNAQAPDAGQPAPVPTPLAELRSQYRWNDLPLLVTDAVKRYAAAPERLRAAAERESDFMTRQINCIERMVELYKAAGDNKRVRQLLEEEFVQGGTINEKLFSEFGVPIDASLYVRRGESLLNRPRQSPSDLQGAYEAFIKAGEQGRSHLRGLAQKAEQDEDELDLAFKAYQTLGDTAAAQRIYLQRIACLDRDPYSDEQPPEFYVARGDCFVEKYEKAKSHSEKREAFEKAREAYEKSGNKDKMRGLIALVEKKPEDISWTGVVELKDILKLAKAADDQDRVRRYALRLFTEVSFESDRTLVEAGLVPEKAWYQQRAERMLKEKVYAEAYLAFAAVDDKEGMERVLEAYTAPISQRTAPSP